MNTKKKNLLIGLVVVVVIGLSGFLGVYFAGGFKNKTVAEGIIITKSNEEYKSALITNYEEYTNLLNKYGVGNQSFLTNGAFDNNDYIVDFIDYKDSLVISDINLEIVDEGINITYIVNKKISNSKKYLMYFIPVDKGLLNELSISNRKFKVK